MVQGDEEVGVAWVEAGLVGAVREVATIRDKSGETPIALYPPQEQDGHMNTSPIVSLRNVSKIYGSGATAVAALDNVSVDFAAGQFTAIVGPSGSGKSTMLHVLAGLDHPTSGQILLENHDITKLSDNQLTELRRDRIGFIFQAFNLIPTLNAYDNIHLPLRLAKRTPDREWINGIIQLLGLQERLTHRPSELSGGQQQRVAVARALASKPAMIVADEPTGNLDSQASAEVLSILKGAVKELGQSVIMVTHDLASAAEADRVIAVRDGRIVADLTGENVTEEAIRGVLR